MSDSEKKFPTRLVYGVHGITGQVVRVFPVIPMTIEETGMYIHVNEVDAMLKQKEAEGWLQAAGLCNSYYDTDKNPMSTPFAKRCIELANEAEGITQS